MALPGLPVWVEVIAYGKYARALVIVTRQGRRGDWFSLNGNMVLMGHAW